MRLKMLFLITIALSVSSNINVNAAPDAPSPAATDVQILNGEVPGSLEVKASHPTKLAPELGVERQQKDGTFVPVINLDLSTMLLVTRCRQQLGKFVIVDEKGMKPVPWSGMSCSSQCNGTCDKNVPLEGHFHFVVHSYKDKTKFVGPIFELKRQDH